MANDPDNAGPRAAGGDGADRDDFDRRLAELNARRGVDAGERGRTGSAESREARSAMAQALRLSSEFVAAVVVGAALGYGLDTLFGTGPWGLIVFLLLGFAAAVVNVMRSAGLMGPTRLSISAAKDASDGSDRTG